MKSLPTYDLENEIGGLVAGTDEAGHGPWAGPVVAAAVILNPQDLPEGLDDSKKLSETKREALFDVIQEKALAIGIADVSPEEIDEINILQASLDAMTRSVESLDPRPSYVLVDGNKSPWLSVPHETLVKGDSRSLSIAAASIIAKVTRDRLMKRLAEDFPEYDWASNKGYGTRAHQEALKTHGVTQHHRKSFKPIHKILIES